MSCTPHYIRCVRPNGQKQPKNFDTTLSTNQVRYLGLLENVRVRRAGFAYRQTYERFLWRFKLLTSKTWPKWNGTPKDGCVTIMKECQIDSSEYELGVTKVFIKKPQTLFALEEFRARKLDDIVSLIQRTWRRCRGKAFFKKVTYTSGEIFYGKKERRADTVFRPFVGDYIKFKNGRIAKGIAKKFKETKIMFADDVKKYNIKLSSQNRVLAVTDQALYNIGGLISSVQRRILLRNISGISLSTLQDNFFVVHVTGEYDYIYESKKKTEIVTIIAELVKDLTGNRPAVAFNDTIQYKVKGGKSKTIQFQKDESCKEAKTKKSGETLIVTVATGLEKASGRQAKKFEKTVQKITINKSNSRSLNTLCTVRAVTEYKAKSAREISFKVGEIINVTKKDSTGMWTGELKGQIGLFPSNHAVVI